MQKKYNYLTSLVFGSLMVFYQDGQSEEIETVLVRAARVLQAKDSLSLSVSVVDAKTLQIQNPDHPAEVLNLLPGVNIHRGSGAEHLSSIRSPVLTGGAGAGSFLYLQDGVPLRSPGFANTNGLLDAQYEFAQQIEVIRGPSGPVHGANAVHGVINVLTPSPTTEEQGSLQLSGDSQQRYKGRGIFGLNRRGQSWLYGLSLNNEQGYRENAGLDQQKGFIRHQYSALESTQIDTILNLNNLNQETAGFVFGKEALNDRTLRRQNAFPFAYRDAQSVHLQSQITRGLSEDSSFKLTPYARWHKMEFLQHFLPSQAVENNGHWSLGMLSDWTVNTEKMRLLSGVDLEYTEGYLREFQSLPTVFSYTQGLHYDYSVKSVNASVFTQVEYDFNEKTQLIAGLRFDSIHYKYNNKTLSAAVGRFVRPEDRADAFTTASPKIAIRYQLSARFNAYLSWSRANRPPQTSDLYRLQINQTSDSAKAERMDAIEWRLNYSDGQRLSANLSVYSMEKKNFFFRDADGFNVNNGRTQHRGIEFDLNLQLLENVELISAFSLAKHSYRFNRVVERDYEIIRFGNEMDSAPNVLANTRMVWQPQNRTLIELQWQKVGAYYTDAANSQLYDGHDIFNLRTVYEVSSSSSISLNFRNLGGELYAERADFAFGEDRYFPGETETVSLNLKTHF